MTEQGLILLFGGKSSEHEVSLSSAAALLEGLRGSELQPLTVGITRTGEWLLYEGEPARIRDGTWERDTARVTPIIPAAGGFFRKSTQEPLPKSVVFPCMHGEYCEDGRLQGMLELFGIPYIGTRCEASAVCFNKLLAKERLRRHRIPVTDWVDGEVRDGDGVTRLCRRAEERFFYPMFVKPSRAGSSIGAQPAHDRKELTRAIAAAAAVDHTVLVEPLVLGREIELSVLDGAVPTVAPAAEPIHGAKYYDYGAKYRGGGARLEIPAKLPPHTAKELARLALAAFRVLGCRHLARIDFFVSQNGAILLNEVNTLPGMTAASVYPRAMERLGIGLPTLMRRLMQLALGDSP